MTLSFDGSVAGIVSRRSPFCQFIHRSSGYPEALTASVKERTLPHDCKLRRVKYLNNVIEPGSGWAVVPGGQIVNNNLVWRRLTFPALSTTRIRVLVRKGAADYARITEVEAY